MYLDAITLSALLDEFMDGLVGGKIQDVLDVDEDSIGLEIYASHRRQYLLLSADNRTPRVHLVPDKLRRGLPKPTQLGLLLRRHIEGGHLLHVSQPPWERVLQFDIHGTEGEVSLIIEPMERRANLLLVQEGIILDCLRRVGAADNRFRTSLPGRPYQPPPPMTDRLDPSEVTGDDLIALLTNADDPKLKAAQALSRKVLGISPLLAREIVFRATGAPDTRAADADPNALAEALHAVAEPLRRREWQPGIVLKDGAVAAFSVYPLQHLDGWEPVESVSAALTDFYGTPTGPEAYAAAKAPVMAAITEARAKLGAKLASLQNSMTDDKEREQIKMAGEMILGYQYAIQPGQTELSAEYEDGLPPMKIKLDPTLTPLENAQAYFSRYNKAKRALDDVPTLIKQTEQGLDHLDLLASDLELASNWPEIDEVQGILIGMGLWKAPPGRRLGMTHSVPIRLVTRDGFVIWVGRNSRQNEMVTFGKGQGDDLWLHVRDVPGAHVIIKSEAGVIPDHVIELAAGLAAYYSARRADGKVEVDVTQVRYVRKIKGAAQGMVTYKNETTRTVQPRDEKSLADQLM
ncbi:MAG: NFACT family protein [Anaerolineae bacterium]|jgi:predicted ribosome quality control (RQC) complex YloA/Tae2 family protein|nr:NFACT family protein [Anaerolineae bacterium]